MVSICDIIKYCVRIDLGRKVVESLSPLDAVLLYMYVNNASVIHLQEIVQMINDCGIIISNSEICNKDQSSAFLSYEHNSNIIRLMCTEGLKKYIRRHYAVKWIRDLPEELLHYIPVVLVHRSDFRSFIDRIKRKYSIFRVCPLENSYIIELNEEETVIYYNGNAEKEIEKYLIDNKRVKVRVSNTRELREKWNTFIKRLKSKYENLDIQLIDISNSSIIYELSLR